MKEHKNFKRLVIFAIAVTMCMSTLQVLPSSTTMVTSTTVALTSNIIYPDNQFDVSMVGITFDWWDTNWQYRKEITIDHLMVTADFTNFPLLINTIDTDLRDKAQDDGDDIVFIDDSGIKLEHEIELFNGTNGELVAWVNVPSLSSIVDTNLHMYYGNPSCSSQQNPEDVWDSSYVMVQHLNEEEEEEVEEDSTVHDLGFSPHALQGDDNYLYVGSMSSSDGVGVKILHKSDFSEYKHLDPSGSGTFIERISVSGDLVAFTQGTKGHVYDMSSDTYVIQVNAANSLRAAYIDGEHVYFGEKDTGKIYRVNITTLVQDDFSPAMDDIREIDSHGDRLIVASNDDNVYLINRISLATIHTFTDSTSNAEVSQIDEDYIWYGSDNKKIWIREADSPYTLLATLTEPTDDITSTFHDGDSWFASCDDGNVYAWDQSSGFSLVRIIDKAEGGGGEGLAAERLWLDTDNKHLYFIIDGDQELWRMDYPLSPSGPSDSAPLDSTSYDNDGTYSGSPTIGVSGRFDGAIDFDGTNDCVNLGNDVSIEPVFLTIAAWIKPDDTNQDRYIVSSKQGGGYSIGINIQGIGVNKITGRSYVTPGGYRNSGGTSDIPIDEWTYVTYTYDGLEIIIYVNGVFENSLSAIGTLRQSGGNLFIGAESGGVAPAGGYFNGIIDEVRISNIARSAEWIEAQYNSMNGGYITLGSEQELPPVADAGGPYEDDDCDYIISFDGTGSYNPYPGDYIAQYDWDLGDGTGWHNDIGSTPSYTYSNFGEYTVTLRVTDNDGLTHTDSTTATVYRAIANAGGPYEDTDCDDDYTIDFAGSGTGYAMPLIYDWDFGDGTGWHNGIGATPSNTYSNFGEYAVTLRVTESGNGCTDTDTATVKIYRVIAETNGPYSTENLNPIQFDSSGSQGYLEPLSYLWDFGDGGTSTLENPTHTYTQVGEYTVTLTITESSTQCFDVDIATAVITSTVTADAHGPYEGIVGVPVDFYGSAADGVVLEFWRWCI